MFQRYTCAQVLQEALDLLKDRGLLGTVVALDGEGNILYRSSMDELSSVAVLARACAEVSWRRVWRPGSGESVFNLSNEED